jgi:hypothetical protein
MYHDSCDWFQRGISSICSLLTRNKLGLCGREVDSGSGRLEVRDAAKPYRKDTELDEGSKGLCDVAQA